MNSKINILPPQVFNLLSAGEVVENPASVIKECVENAIDAGATEVEVIITSGGMDIIEIHDNGSGIAESEVEKVFMPHATSKISSGNDLEKIMTLGFRGEAMSSIASVSNITLVTKTENTDNATELFLSAGEIKSKTKTSRNKGTSFYIKNLFFNTPARKKFLKSGTAERANVTNMISKLILANPHVALKYVTDGTTHYDYRVGDIPMLSAICAIYGKDITGEIIPVDTVSGDMAINGYISKPSYIKRNRTYQTVMVNSRNIDGGIIAEGANSAFSTYMTSGNFAFFVLNLKVDEKTVDVNVHPRKAEVKFDREGQIYEFVKNAITGVIDEHLYSQHAHLNKVFADNGDNKGGTENYEQKNNEQINSGEKTPNSLSWETFNAARNDEEVVFVKNDSNSDLEKIKTIKNFINNGEQLNEVHTSPNVLNMLDEKYYGDKKLHRGGRQESISQIGTTREILGTVFECYILVRLGDKLLIIDQHAAHERLLYDEIKAQVDNDKVVTQPLLSPIMIYLNATEQAHIEPYLDTFKSIGFDMSIFGVDCIRVSGVPLALAGLGSRVYGTIVGLFTELKREKSSAISDIIRDKLIMQSCKAAIKGGTRLSTSQAEIFISQFEKTEVTPVCPHGRPIIISLDKTKIEKMFARK